MSAGGRAEERRTVRADAVAWFARLRREDVTEADRRAFDRWLSSAPAHADAYRDVDALWSSNAFAEAAAAHARTPVRQRRDGRARRSGFVRFAAVAMLVVVLATGADRLWAPVPGDIGTSVGERTQVALEDGSIVHLDTASSLDVAFPAGLRTLSLHRGQAYVEAAPDPDRPLVVTAGAVSAMALGTAFSVHREDEEVIVAVRHGKVRLDYAGTDAAVLGPGDAAAIAEAGTVRRFSADEAMFAWTEGRLVFAQRPFGEVLDELRRYHSGTIVLLRGDLGSIPVSGSYRLDDPAATVAALAEVVGARLTRLTGRVLIVR